MKLVIKKKINKYINVLNFKNIDNLSSYAVKIVKDLINKKEKIHFFLPGGSTPIPFYRLLSSEIIFWQNVSLSLTDERITSLRLKKNKTIINENFFKNLKTKKKPLYYNFYNNRKKNIKNFELINESKIITVLGIGEDGHIASLFRGDFEINEKEYFCFSKKKHMGIFRISISLKQILKSEMIIILLSGKNKKNLYKSIINNKLNKNVPIATLLNNYKKKINILFSE